MASLTVIVLPIILCGILLKTSTAMTLRDYAKVLDDNEEYAVMFDAGSSGTRVKVYKYTKKEGLPMQVEDFEHVEVPKPNKVKPGLSSFASNIAGIQNYLEPLIDSAKKVIPDEKQAKTSLRIFATAGMRLLTDDEVKAIFDEVDSLMENKEINTFSYKKGDAKVISGQDEALYDWVTVNFLKGALSGGHKKTFGALDMGGASHQNSFEMRKNKPKYKPHTVNLELVARKFNIYARSYLGGGEKEARNYFLKQLITSSEPINGDIIYSSCHNYGLIRNVSVDGKEYEVRGDFTRPEKCAKLMKKWFFCPLCDYKNQPRLRGDFYAFSVFRYCFEGTGLVSGEDEVVPMQKIDDKIVSFCNKRFDELDYEDDPYQDVLCFQLNYIRALLRYGYKVGRDFTLHSASTLNGFKLNWAVGAALITNDLL